MSYLKLIRPPLFVLGFLASAALLAQHKIWEEDMLRAGLTMLAIGFGNAAFTVYNEIHDVPQDRINKPWKPLPSGQVSMEGAVFIAKLFTVISVSSVAALAVMYSPSYLLAGIAGYITAYLYNSGVRDTFGNFCLGLTYFVAAYMSTGFTDALFPLAFGLLTVAHNLLVQLQDMEADRRVGLVTAPIELGVKWTLRLSYILSFLVIIILAFAPIGIVPYVLFSVAAVVVGLVTTNPKRIELYLRIIVRGLMVVGFVAMLLEVVV